MNKRFEILCNHCGLKVIVESFENKVVCQNCQTYLQIEETETTVSSIIINKDKFLELEEISTIYDIETTDRIQFFKGELQRLEDNWAIDLESFKLKNGKKRNLPRRKQSLIFLIISVILILVGTYSILFSKNENYFSLIMGAIWLYTSSREYNKFRAFKESEEDYLNEKERLEYEIKLLNSD